MDALGLALLVVGYPTALAGIARLRPTFRRRDRTWFLIAVGGALCIAAGWALRGREAGIVTNGTWALVLLVAWWWTGRRRRDGAAPPA